MTLKEYLDLKNISPEEFSARTGISRASIYRYLKGHKPSLSIAMVIHAATKKSVPMEELRGQK